MVRKEGTRFGTSTGHTVRRSSVPSQHLYSGQNIVITTTINVKGKAAHRQARASVQEKLKDETFNVKGSPEDHPLTFSLNKAKRWEAIDDLKEDHHFVITEQHIGTNWRSSDSTCVGVYESAAARVTRPKKAYARAADLLSQHRENDDVTLTEDDDFGKKNRKRSRKKNIRCDEENYHPATRIQYDVNIVAPRKAYETNTNCKTVDDIGPDQSFEEDLYFEQLWDPDPEYFDSDDEENYRQEEMEEAAPVARSRTVPASLSTIEAQPRYRQHHNGLSSATTVSGGTKDKKADAKVRKQTKRKNKKKKKLSRPVPQKPSVQVSVSSDSLIQDILRGVFSENYQEGLCTPRRFAINITSNIIDDLRSSARYRLADGLLQTGHNIFTIIDCMPAPDIPLRGGNSLMENIKVKVSGVSESQDLLTHAMTSTDIHSLSDVIRNISQAVAVLPADGYLTEGTLPTSPTAGFSLETVHHTLRWGYNFISEHKATHEILSIKDATNSQTGALVPVPNASNNNAYCDICYEKLKEKSSGTTLIECGHCFCDECWGNHVIARVIQGERSITCPGFNCKTNVDKVTLMSLLPSYLYARHHQRKVNSALMLQPHFQWCPSPNCGRLVRFPGRNKDDMKKESKMIAVSCECGSFWCSECKEEAHWPATCQQARTYRQEAENPITALQVKDRIDFVRAKCCPQCHSAIEKNGGCSDMRCICGHHFYWSNKRYQKFDVRTERSALEVAIMHHQKRTDFAIRKRFRNATKLAFESIFGAEVQRRKTEEDDAVPPTYLSSKLICSKKTLQRLQEMMHLMTETAKFLSEAEFVLEHLEILLANIPPGEKDKVLLHHKGRLIFITEHLHRIFDGDVDLDVTEVKHLLHSGRSCLSSVAIAADSVNKRIMSSIEE